MKTFYFGPHGISQFKVDALNLRRAINTFRVGALFPHTYSTTRVRSPDPNGSTYSYVYLSSEPGGVIPVYEITPKGWVLVDEIPPETTELEHVPLPGVDGGLIPATQAVSRRDLEDRELELRRQMGELERLKQEAESALSALRKEVQGRVEQVWLIELFLGSQEEVKQIAFGDPAPVDTPITVCQRVLCMDEEIAVYDVFHNPERIGNFDYRDVGAFDTWLTSDPEHLKTVFPYPKGIVGLRVRRKRKERGGTSTLNVFQNSQAEEYDEMTYLLIVNGSDIYRMWIDVNLWPRMFPSEADTADTPPTSTLHAKLSASEAEARRKQQLAGLVAITGILQRSEILHPLPKPNINALNPEDVDLYLNLVHDDEDRLLLGDGRPFEGLTWYDYNKWLRSQLTHGVRVLWTGTRGGDLHERTGIQSLYTWPSHTEVFTLQALPQKDYYGAEWSFLYLPKGEVYDGYDYKPRSRRVSFNVYGDEVTPIDYLSWRVLEHLIRDRGSRGEYVEFFGLAATFYRLAKLQAEEERPFINLVLSMAGVSQDNEPERARAERLTRWWKMKTKEHRTLSTDEAKALRMILSTFTRGDDEMNDPEYTLLNR